MGRYFMSVPCGELPIPSIVSDSICFIKKSSFVASANPLYGAGMISHRVLGFKPKLAGSPLCHEGSCVEIGVSGDGLVSQLSGTLRRRNPFFCLSTEAIIHSLP